MTATDSMAIRACSRRSQLNDTISPLDLLPMGRHAGETQVVEPMRASTEREISFGPFRLFPYQRLLTKAGKEVRVGSWALDILITLLEHPGRLVTRRELMERVWPGTVVVEANINVNIAALRRALGDGQDGNRYLVTIPGRGYRFVAPATFSDFKLRDRNALRTVYELTTPIARLVGQDEIVKRLTGQLRQRGFITLSGLGDVLGVEPQAQEAISKLVAELKEEDVLLVLDNCEHLVGAVSTSAIVLLKTAREPAGSGD